MKTATAVLMCGVVLCGCDKKESGGTSSGSTANYSSPRAAVETMFAAAKAGDKALFLKCWATNAEGEFKRMEEKGETAEFMKVFATGKVTDAPEVPKDAKMASVNITFVDRGKEKKESVTVVLEGSEWKVQGM